MITKALAALALLSGVASAQANLSALNPAEMPLALLHGGGESGTARVMAAAVKGRGKAKPAPLRISTGVVAPVLVKKAKVVLDKLTVSAQGRRPAIVALMVDEKGRPSELKIVQSADETSDASVLRAVSQFRFRPATVSGMPTACPVNLTVEIAE